MMVQGSDVSSVGANSLDKDVVSVCGPLNYKRWYVAQVQDVEGMNYGEDSRMFYK